MSTAIQINHVHKHYGELHALKDISLIIEQGEFFGLLGPNGAGKSTLINIIAGLTRSDSGQVAVMGHDVVKHYRRSRQCIGVVPQELAFDPFFSVREILQIQAGYFGKSRQAKKWIDTLLEGLKLTDKADANMRQLSGGMKRRVLIAQALVHKPDVVILDEPTAGVDVEVRKSLWEFVKRLHSEGHTIVLTTHYLEEAEHLCERIAILNKGKLIALDSKDALLARGVSTHRTVAVTLAQPLGEYIEKFAGKIQSINGSIIEFHLNRDSDTIVSLLDELRELGAEIIDLRTEDADLEDVFIELTGQHTS